MQKYKSTAGDLNFENSCIRALYEKLGYNENATLFVTCVNSPIFLTIADL